MNKDILKEIYIVLRALNVDLYELDQEIMFPSGADWFKHGLDRYVHIAFIPSSNDTKLFS